MDQWKYGPMRASQRLHYTTIHQLEISQVCKNKAQVFDQFRSKTIKICSYKFQEKYFPEIMLKIERFIVKIDFSIWKYLPEFFSAPNISSTGSVISIRPQKCLSFLQSIWIATD